MRRSENGGKGRRLGMRQNKDLIELAAAARLLAGCQAMPMDKNHSKSGTSADKAQDHVAPFTWQALLKEARVMAGGNADNLAAIDAIEKTIAVERTAIRAAQFVDHDVLLPDSGTMTYTITFAGNQPMEISVYANGPAAIDWHVFR